VVLADQATQDLPALDPGSDIDGAAGLPRRFLPKALMRTVAVIAADELGQHFAEMPLAEDQDVIQALAAERSREPPGKCIRMRRPDRRLDDPRAIAGEDAVKCRGELAVPVADQKSDAV
jgi:hypothetical protein